MNANDTPIATPPGVLQAVCDERTRENRAAIDALRELVARLDHSVSRLDHTVYGNGEPGALTRLAVLEKAVAAMEARLEKQAQGKIDTWRAVVAAVAASVVSVILSAVATFLLARAFA